MFIESIVAEKSFPNPLDLHNGIGLSLVCKHTHIPHQGSHKNIASVIRCQARNGMDDAYRFVSVNYPGGFPLDFS